MMAEEARNCFASLLETGQRLLDELEGILKASNVRQGDELVRKQPADEPDDRPRKTTKSSSSHPHRVRNPSPTRSSTKQDAEDVILGPESPERGQAVGDVPTPSEPRQPPHLTDGDALRLAQRKRKTMSACSLGDSNAARYRSKTMVVVYYDGEIQQRFDSVVRTIGTCRNSMRKGKMSAKIDSLSRGGSSSGEESLGEEVLSPNKLHCYSSRVRPNRIPSGLDGTQAFDSADHFLDKAQALCERAAHQVLRDGDCATEVQNARKNIISAIEVGQAEMPVLEKKAEKAAEQRKKEEAEEEQRKAKAGREDEKHIASDEESRSDGFCGRSPPDNLLEVDELEVDSSAEDSEPSLTILDTVRLGKFHVRTTTRVARNVHAA